MKPEGRAESHGGGSPESVLTALAQLFQSLAYSEVSELNSFECALIQLEYCEAYWVGTALQGPPLGAPVIHGGGWATATLRREKPVARMVAFIFALWLLV